MSESDTFQSMQSIAWSGSPLAAFPLARTRVAGLCDRVARILENCATKGVDRFEFVVSERIIENPLVAAYVRPGDRRILDFGGYEGVVALQLAAVGHEVTVWDQRPYPFRHENIQVMTADIFGTGWSDQEPFDLVYSISTVEHLGLGHYGDTTVPGGDSVALKTLWSLVRPGGRLVVTVPAGKPTEQRGYRVYDDRTLRTAFPHDAIIRYFSKPNREGMWSETDAESIAQLEYSEPHKPRPCEAVAILVADKPE